MHVNIPAQHCELPQHLGDVDVMKSTSQPGTWHQGSLMAVMP